MVSRSLLSALAAALLSAGGAALARPLALANCIGADVLTLHPGDDAALLDDDERRGMAEAIGRRHRLLGPGFLPASLALWRRPQGDWVFVAIERHADKPGGACFSATVSADGFPSETRALRLKYRLGGRPA